MDQESTYKKFAFCRKDIKENKMTDEAIQTIRTILEGIDDPIGIYDIPKALTALDQPAAQKPVVGNADSPVGIDPAWVNFDNEGFTWDDLAQYLVGRFKNSDIEDLVFLLMQRCPSAAQKPKLPLAMLTEVLNLGHNSNRVGPAQLLTLVQSYGYEVE
jgi:hypothetical protein